MITNVLKYYLKCIVVVRCWSYKFPSSSSLSPFVKKKKIEFSIEFFYHKPWSLKIYFRGWSEMRTLSTEMDFQKMYSRAFFGYQPLEMHFHLLTKRNLKI